MQFHRLQCRQDNVQVLGDLPQPGQPLPGFMLVDSQFNDVSLAAFAGRPVAVMTVLSLELEDSRRLAHRFAERPWPPQVCRLLVSSDLPLAQSRHLQEMGLSSLVPLSTLRGRDFHPTWGGTGDRAPVCRADGSGPGAGRCRSPGLACRAPVGNRG